MPRWRNFRSRCTCLCRALMLITQQVGREAGPLTKTMRVTLANWPSRGRQPGQGGKEGRKEGWPSSNGWMRFRNLDSADRQTDRLTDWHRPAAAGTVGAHFFFSSKAPSMPACRTLRKPTARSLAWPYSLRASMHKRQIG